MATVARHLLMLSSQSEFGFVMVEPPPSPGPLRMALGTGFPQPAEVGIVFFMAIDTTRRRFPVFFPGNMAVAALGGTMLALEDEVRCFMTEGFQVQLNDVCGPAFMVGVTMFALVPFHLGIAAMKPFFLFEVNTHRLVALQALFILSAFFKQDVTLGALRFVFGVTLDHRPRHQKLFIRKGICWHNQQHYHSSQQSSKQYRFHAYSKNQLFLIFDRINTHEPQ